MTFLPSFPGQAAAIGWTLEYTEHILVHTTFGVPRQSDSS